MTDWAKAAADEIETLVAELCKPWTAFHGHAPEFARIIRRASVNDLQRATIKKTIRRAKAKQRKA